AGDQQHAAPGAALGGEGAVRSFRKDACPPLHLQPPARVIAEILTRDAHAPRRGRGREGEGMRLPPATRRQEPPQEELPRARVELVEMATAHVDRGNARGLALYALDAQTVTPVAAKRLEQSATPQGGAAQ